MDRRLFLKLAAPKALAIAGDDEVWGAGSSHYYRPGKRFTAMHPEAEFMELVTPNGTVLEWALWFEPSTGAYCVAHAGVRPVHRNGVLAEHTRGGLWVVTYKLDGTWLRDRRTGSVFMGTPDYTPPSPIAKQLHARQSP